MTEEAIPKAFKNGVIKIGNMELKVVTLNDGSRIIEEQSFFDFSKAMAEGNLDLTTFDMKELAEFVKLGKIKGE